jgi:hypothetical protein
MAEQFDAADAALGHFDFLALVFENVPQGRHGIEPILADANGGPAVHQQRAFESESFLGRKVRILLARDFFEGGGAGLEHLADGFALLAAVRLAGSPAELDVSYVHVPGLGLNRAGLADGPAGDGADVSRLFPAAQFLAVLAHAVQHVVQPIAEEFPRPLHHCLSAVHVRTSLVARRSTNDAPRAGAGVL